MSITIQEIDDRDLWNTFLASQTHGHMLQSYEWGELSKLLGRTVYRLGAIEDGKLVGTMQLVVAPVPLPLPKLRPNWLYCARGPTLARPDRQILAKLFEYVHVIARKERAVVLRVEPNIADDDSYQDAWLAHYYKLGFQTNPNSIHGRRSWVLDIRPASEQLYAAFEPRWRRSIQSAEKSGIAIREAHCEEDFASYYQLLKASNEREGVSVPGQEYLREMLRAFTRKRDAVLLLAEHGEQTIAARMLIRLGGWCWDMFGGSREGYEYLRAEYLVQYRSLQWAKARGCVYFDFRAIPEVLVPGEDLWDAYEFKQGFGGFSRLNMPTQDYVYQPLIYKPWRRLVEMRQDEQRHKQRQLANQEGAPLSKPANHVQSHRTAREQYE